MGKTILISSHILHELAELCNTVGIIERGDLVFQGTVDDVVRKARMGRVFHVAVSDRTQEAAKLLQQTPGVAKVATASESRPVGSVGHARGNGSEQSVIHVTLAEDATVAASDIPNRLINAGFRLTQFSEESVNLETAFMRLTRGLVQ